MKVPLTIGIVAMIAFATSAAAEAITNDSIIALTKAGLSEGLIIDKVNSEACNYDVTTDKLISLRQSGVADAVIGAMVRRCATLSQQRGIAGDDSSSDPKVRHSPGIYAMESWLNPNKLQGIRPSKPSGVRSTGNGSIIFPFVTKMVVPGTTSHIEVPTNNPEFYFYFNASDEKVSDFGMENSMAAQSPDEFSLVKFSKKGEDREISVGKVSFYEGFAVSARKGVDAKYTIHFQTDQVGEGMYKVTIDKGLDAGEYAFIFTGANGNSRIYDFSITSTQPKTK
jgi:hypothetical protein